MITPDRENFIRYPMKNHILILQKHLINLALLLLVLLVVPSTRAGENLDSLFVEARHAAIELENRALAIELCRHALEVNPNYHDFRILMGRCYSWEGNYDKAEAELGQVVEAVESYQDARVSRQSNSDKIA